MPRQAGRPCAWPGCPAIVHGHGVRLCREHLQEAGEGRPCAWPGCPAIVHGYGVRLCREHLHLVRREQDRARGSAAERGYDARWRLQ